MLYGFGYVHGKSTEVLTKYYEDGFKEPALTCESIKTFYKMTRCKPIRMKESRRALTEFTKRLQRSENFLPEVSELCYENILSQI